MLYFCKNGFLLGSMSISPISNIIYSNLSFLTTNPKLQAIQIFGKDLAESLKMRDDSWEKVIESWNISLIACKTIKELKHNFSDEPKRIYCENQVNNGLIFKTLKNWNNEKQKYNDEITEGELVIPYGCIYMKFRNTESMKQFIDPLEKNFYKQSLDSSIYHAVYSFTLDPNKIAAYKPSHYYDKCGSALEEEFGENEYSRSQALKIYKILSDHADILIEGQAITTQSMSDDIC